MSVWQPLGIFLFFTAGLSFDTYFTLSNAGNLRHLIIPLPFTFVIYSSQDGHKKIAIFFPAGNSCFRFRTYDSAQCLEAAHGPYSARIIGFPDGLSGTHAKAKGGRWEHIISMLIRKLIEELSDLTSLWIPRGARRLEEHATEKHSVLKLTAQVLTPCLLTTIVPIVMLFWFLKSLKGHSGNTSSQRWQSSLCVS